MNNITVFTGESIQLPEILFVRLYFEFTGWKISDNLIICIDGCDIVYLTGNIDLR